MVVTQLLLVMVVRLSAPTVRSPEAVEKKVAVEPPILVVAISQVLEVMEKLAELLGMVPTPDRVVIVDTHPLMAAAWFLGRMMKF